MINDRLVYFEPDWQQLKNLIALKTACCVFLSFSSPFLIPLDVEEENENVSNSCGMIVNEETDYQGNCQFAIVKSEPLSGRRNKPFYFYNFTVSRIACVLLIPINKWYFELIFGEIHAKSKRVKEMGTFDKGCLDDCILTRKSSRLNEHHHLLRAIRKSTGSTRPPY